jgi:hypothetical protein
MKRVLITIASIAALTTSMFAGQLVNVSGASGIALDGYDPVAFFTLGKPTHGDPGISATLEGATYLFASKEHKRIFEADPRKYLPQFGGFCAYGAALNALFPVDINTWQVRDGKLYLNLNPTILKAFNQDFDGNVKKAQKNWAGLVQKSAK